MHYRAHPAPKGGGHGMTQITKNAHTVRICFQMNSVLRQHLLNKNVIIYSRTMQAFHGPHVNYSII